MYDFLKGLRVVEGASFIAAPTCGLYLAQMGAEVIRFDQVGGGPDFRRWPLAPGSADKSLYWEGLNKGKKSIAIDLGRPEGRELAVALATAPGEQAFVTNYPVAGFLSHEALKARREDIVTCRVMGWADGSPALDYTVNAAIGVPLITGPADDPRPVNHVLPAWDFLTGALAAFHLTAAVARRRETGQGAEIRLPLSDVAAASLSHMGTLAEAMFIGDRPRLGNDIYGAFGRDFLCADGVRLMVTAITPRQWAGLVKALDLSGAVAALEQELGADFSRNEAARFDNRARLYPLFEAAFAARGSAELAAAFDESGVTWSRYQPLSEAAHDPRLFEGNPIFQAIAHPSGLTYPAAGPAATLAGEPRRPPTPAPRLGQHTDEILAGVLGLPQAEIGRLHDRGIVA